MPEDGAAADNQGGQGSSGAAAGGQTGGGEGTGTILNPAGGGQQAGGQAGTGVAITDWRTSLPESFRSNKVFENIKAKDLNEALPILVKNYVEAQQYIGGAVKIPKPTDPPEKLNEFYDKIGRPKTPEDYSFNVPDTGKVSLDPEALKSFTKTAHKVGLTNSQMQGVLDWYGGFVNQTQGTHETNQKKALQTLKEEWGGNFERKAVLAQRAAKEFGGPKLMEALDRTGLGNDPDFIKFFSDIGEILAEEGLISGHIKGIPGPAEAKEQIAKIMSDPNDLYHSQFDGKPGHTERVAHVQKLYQIAYGE